MNTIGSGTAAAAALSTVTQTNPTSTGAGAQMLKKALAGQQSEVTQLLQMLDGKGKNIDIRA
jgi:Putative motility protein